MPLSDGGFIVTTTYDEAGYPLRRYSSSGQPIFASNLAQKDYMAIALAGDNIYAAVGKGARRDWSASSCPATARMANGAADYRLFADGEKAGPVGGLAVIGGQVYVAASGLNVVRVIDLATGAARPTGLCRQSPTWRPTPRAPCGDFRQGRGRPGSLRASPAACQRTGEAAVPGSGHRPSGRGGPHGRQARHLGLCQRKGGADDGQPRARPVDAGLAPDVQRSAGMRFLGDGRLVLTEHARVRILWPETGRISGDFVSDFMDQAVVHPTRPEYVYCYMGVFRVDPKNERRGPGWWKPHKA